MNTSDNSQRTGFANAIKNDGARGFSLVELFIVVAVIFVLTAISIPYLYSYKKLYKSEDQALKVLDLMQETSQLALNKRRTFRFEIDLTDNTALIIDEAGANPDVLVKSIPLEPTSEIRMDGIPTGLSRPDPPKYNDAAFANDSLGHRAGSATVSNHSVWAARFRSDGSAVNAADTPTSVNLYIWPPKNPGTPSDKTPRNKTEVRGITMFGGSGAVRYWKYDGTAFQAY